MNQDRERLNKLLISIGQQLGKEFKLGIYNSLMVRQSPDQGGFTTLFTGNSISDICSYVEGMLYGAALIEAKRLKLLNKIQLLETAIKAILSVEKEWEENSDSTLAASSMLDIAKNWNLYPGYRL